MSESEQDLDCNILYHPGEFGGEFGNTGNFNYSYYADYYEEYFGNDSFYFEENHSDEDNDWEKNFKVQPIDLVVAILIGLISVGGIIGHGLILFILFCRPSRKTWTRSMMQLNSIFALSYLIVQTSRDIFTILSGEAQLKTTSWGRFRNCVSRYVFKIIFLRIWKTQTSCKFINLWVYVCSGVNIMSNVAMMADRCLGIKKPFLRAKLLGSSTNKILVKCFVVGFPCAVATPLFFFHDQICGLCMPSLSPTITNARNVYAFVIFAFLFIFPIVISSILTWVINNTKGKRNCGLRKSSNAKDGEFIHKLHKYNKTDSIIYCFCFLPFYLLDVVKELVPFWVVEQILHICLYISRILVVSYFCISPLLYFGFFEIHKVLSSNKKSEIMTNAGTRDLLKKNNKMTSNGFSKEFQKPRVISLDKGFLTDKGLFPAIENDFGAKCFNKGLKLQPIINVNVTANIHNHSCDSSCHASPTGGRSNISEANCSINIVI